MESLYESPTDAVEVSNQESGPLAEFLTGVFFFTGVVFWAPDVIVHAKVGNGFSVGSVILLTPLLPVVTCVVGTIVLLHRGRDAVVSCLVGTVGIWVTGPFFMMVSATYGGGGFTHSGGLMSVLVLTLSFPVSTFALSTYDGTLFAVLGVTVMLPATGLMLSASQSIHRE